MDQFINDDTHIIQDTKLLSLNSLYATKLNGTKNSRVLFDFINIIDKSKDHLYMTMAVQSAEIPASYYNINDRNNVTSITRGGGAGTIVITMPVGNYDANTYVAQFKTLYEAATSNVILNMTFSSVTGKYSVQETSSGQQVITFNAAASNSFPIIGGGTTDLTFPPFSAQAIPSPFPFIANFLGITKIKVCSDNLAGTNVDSSQLKTTTLIDTISANAGPFGLNIFNSLGRETFMKSKRIEEIDIQLKDQDDNLIDFNNAEWCMSFIINTHRRVAFSEDQARGVIVNDKYKKQLRATELAELRGETEKELEQMNFSELDDLL